MRVILSRLTLSGLLTKIQNITPVKPVTPALSNLLLEAHDDQLIISATDGTVSMRIYLDAEVKEEGAIALPARQFVSLVRELTAPILEIHTPSAETAALNSGSSHFKIRGMLKEEFPQMPNLQEGTSFTIPSKGLKEILSRSVFSAAKSDSQNTLNSVLLQHTDKAASVMTTDGKRLTKIAFLADLPPQTSQAYLIPLKAAEEVIHILDAKEDDLICITLMKDKIAFEMKAITLISKLFSGKFPDVGRIIPTLKSDPLSLHREELIALLRQVALFTSEEHNSVRFSFLPGELQISTNAAMSGEGMVKMPVNYSGSRLDIAFNPAYLLEALRHIKDETVNLSVTDSHNPGLLTDSTSAQFVIMPMRLEG